MPLLTVLVLTLTVFALIDLLSKRHFLWFCYFSLLQGAVSDQIHQLPIKFWRYNSIDRPSDHCCRLWKENRQQQKLERQQKTWRRGSSRNRWGWSVLGKRSRTDSSKSYDAARYLWFWRGRWVVKLLQFSCIFSYDRISHSDGLLLYIHFIHL